MAVEPEQLLDADRHFRSALGGIVDRNTRAGRRGEMRRSLGFEPAAQIPWHKPEQRIGQVALDRWRSAARRSGSAASIGSGRSNANMSDAPPDLGGSRSLRRVRPANAVIGEAVPGHVLR